VQLLFRRELRLTLETKQSVDRVNDVGHCTLSHRTRGFVFTFQREERERSSSNERLSDTFCSLRERARSSTARRRKEQANVN